LTKAEIEALKALMAQPEATTVKRTGRTWTDEEKEALAKKLWGARAGKYGLTIPELKSLHLRAGVAPSEEQIAKTMKARGGSDSKKPAKGAARQSK
jgi:hypothetical protein